MGVNPAPVGPEPARHSPRPLLNDNIVRRHAIMEERLYARPVIVRRNTSKTIVQYYLINDKERPIVRGRPIRFRSTRLWTRTLYTRRIIIIIIINKTINTHNPQTTRRDAMITLTRRARLFRGQYNERPTEALIVF